MKVNVLLQQKESNYLRGLIDELIRFRTERLDFSDADLQFQIVRNGNVSKLVTVAIYFQNRQFEWGGKVATPSKRYRVQYGDFVALDEIMYQASCDSSKERELSNTLKLYFGEHHFFVYNVLYKIQWTCMESLLMPRIPMRLARPEKSEHHG